MRNLLSILIVFLVLFFVIRPGLSEVVRLNAIADIWLSDANEKERNTSAGRFHQFKLKTIQEMAAIRFDPTPAKGREVIKATLFMRKASSDMLRYIRVSTVNQDWVEGSSSRPYGLPDGATYLYADYNTKRFWAWPGSQFCDVIMSSGNSLSMWGERKELENNRISVDLTPELIYALVTDNTDGLAIMDGGNPAYHNNLIHSVESKGSEPYIEVELGKPLTNPPNKPVVRIEPAPERAKLNSGAVKITIDEDKAVFCWRLTLDKLPVDRWKVKHPVLEGHTIFYLDDLPPKENHTLKVVAVAPGGATSSAAVIPFKTSPSLSREVALEPLLIPASDANIGYHNEKIKVWALPGLVKISPEKPEAMFDDIGNDDRDYQNSNGVWNGGKVKLFGARGEYVSFQLCIENLNPEPLSGIQIQPGILKGPNGFSIGKSEIELFKNWYAKNRKGQWQPAYCIPLKHSTAFQIPDELRKLSSQQNQTIYVDIYIPKDAVPGQYSGKIRITAPTAHDLFLPVELSVYDFVLPDRLTFWPELNAYRIPKNAHDFYRLAHQHRCVANFWRWKPKLNGAGKNISVSWYEYDSKVGPLLTGESFKNNRRAGAPVECMYLPFEDSWPTPLSKKTYSYQGHWPVRGESKNFITDHYMTAPYIGDALSKDYKEAFLAVQRQFIEHFKQKGWDQTEMQCFFGGKNTHRIKYGSNMWWTTDEPYHWDDWLALQFFCRLWSKGRGEADPKLWAARADISRPNWQGRVLDGIVDTVYFGRYTNPFRYQRCRLLKQNTGLKLMAYGSANPDDESNINSVVTVLNAWLNGANGFLPWQTIGKKKALDINDRAGSGNAILVPGNRFQQKVVGDMRLKALRDGQQITEYLEILAELYGMQREQVKTMVYHAFHFKDVTKVDANPKNANAFDFEKLKAWQIAELRRRLVELIVGEQVVNTRAKPKKSTILGTASTTNSVDIDNDQKKRQEGNGGDKREDVKVYYKYDFDKNYGGFKFRDNVQVKKSQGAISGEALRIERKALGGRFGASLPVKISKSENLKIAYHCKASGVPGAGLNVFDKLAKDNTTSNAYRWLSDTTWTPVLYFLDTFRYNSRAIGTSVRSDTSYREIRFHGEKKESKDTWMELDNFVVYRGDDHSSPDQVQGLKAITEKDGVYLSWKPATDNTAVMLYVISRAEAGKPFYKIGESFVPYYTDRFASPGTYQYRVLACDFEENLGNWSIPANVFVTTGTRVDKPVLPVEAVEREGYREHVLEIYRRGKGQVDRNMVLCYGDSLTGATLYPLKVQAALGTKKVVGKGYAGKKTSFGRTKAAVDFDRVNPYLALILFGTNNRKDPVAVKEAMEDIEAIVRIAEERGIIPVFGTIPPRGFEDRDSKPEAAFNKALIETCRRLKVPCGHLFEEYQRYPNRRKLIARDGVHNTKVGMATSARAWRRVVEQVHFVLRDGN